MTYLLRIRWWLLIALLTGAPFHAFLITWLENLADGDQTWVLALSGWREVIFLIIGIIVLLELLVRFWRERRLPHLDLLDWLIIAYFGLALIWLPFQINEPVRWLLGIRFDMMPLIFYVIIRHVPWPGREKLVRAALAAAGLVIIFGLLHALILPQDFLEYFGYSDYQGQYEAGTTVSACQYLEHTDRVCRATSTFGGPTRYGTYLLLVMGLLVPITAARNYKFKILNNKFKIPKYWPHALLILTAISAVLTFSRSIWIGLFAMGIFAFFWLVPNKLKSKIIFGAAVIFVAVFFAWQITTLWNHAPSSFPPKFITTIFVRDTSTSEHFYLTQQGIKTATTHPFGLGLGTSGPASVRFQKSLTENWFVQIAVEMGVPGLLLFLAILFVLSKKLLRGVRRWRKLENPHEALARFGLFLALLGIAVTGLFTHSFEETTTIMLLAAFAGIFLPGCDNHKMSKGA